MSYPRPPALPALPPSHLHRPLTAHPIPGHPHHLCCPLAIRTAPWPLLHAFGTTPSDRCSTPPTPHLSPPTACAAPHLRHRTSVHVPPMVEIGGRWQQGEGEQDRRGWADEGRPKGRGGVASQEGEWGHRGGPKMGGRCGWSSGRGMGAVTMDRQGEAIVGSNRRGKWEQSRWAGEGRPSWAVIGERKGAIVVGRQGEAITSDLRGGEGGHGG